MKLIRKISIGRDYKDNAMHYQIGQEVYGNHVITNILEKDTLNVFQLMIISPEGKEKKARLPLKDYEIYIKKNKEVLLWTSFNKNMGISVEYNLDYE